MDTSKADTTSGTSTAQAIARAHYEADRRALAAGERLTVKGPVGYATGVSGIADDLREIAGYTAADLDALDGSDLDEIREAVVDAYGDMVRASKAAAALGAAGRGSSKRRGDSDHYRALVARRWGKR